jgi:hypothetical protein
MGLGLSEILILLVVIIILGWLVYKVWRSKIDRIILLVIIICITIYFIQNQRV